MAASHTREDVVVPNPLLWSAQVKLHSWLSWLHLMLVKQSQNRVLSTVPLSSILHNCHDLAWVWPRPASAVLDHAKTLFWTIVPPGQHGQVCIRFDSFHSPPRLPQKSLESPMLVHPRAQVAPCAAVLLTTLSLQGFESELL